MKKRKVGVFGGSFDPIHLGHLNLAIQLKEIHSLQEVLFFPAFCSPYKKSDAPKAEGAHRLKMVKLAIRGIEGFSAYSFEIQKAAISYTIDTIRMLKEDEDYRKAELHLLLSEDSLEDFDRWKEAEQILALAPPLVGCRASSPFPASISKKFLQIFRKGITRTKIMEISSTEVRQRLKKGLFCGHLLPKEVLRYIDKNKLYY